MKLKQVVNGTHAIDVINNRMLQALENEPDVVHECIVRPFRAPKTYKQIKTIHGFCNECSSTDVNEWMGHTPQWWKNHYKLKIYVPVLENQAHEDEDHDFLDLLSGWRKVWSNALPQDKPFIEKQLAENSALSYADAKKEHLIQVIYFIIKDAAHKGILLTIPEDKDK